MKIQVFSPVYGDITIGNLNIFVGEDDVDKRYLMEHCNTFSDGRIDIFPSFGVSHPHVQMSCLKRTLKSLIQDPTYRVFCSTNTTPILEFTWAFQCLKERLTLQCAKHPDRKEEFTSYMEAAFCKFFHSENQKSFRGLMDLDIVVYMMLPNDKLKDISNLDPGSDDVDEREFGGMSTVAEKTGELVSDFADWNDTDKVPDLSRKLTTERHVF